MALVMFAGLAQGEVYAQYWQTLNSRGWIAPLNIGGGWQVTGHYNYNDHAVWKTDRFGCLYIPYHENWHISWTVKLTRYGKPGVITQYNYMYSLNVQGPIKYICGGTFKSKWQGYVRAIDPQAVEGPSPYGTEMPSGCQSKNPDGYCAVWPLWGFWGLYAGHDKTKDLRKPPAITDTAQSIADLLSGYVPLQELPLLRQVVIYNEDGTTLWLSISPE